MKTYSKKPGKRIIDSKNIKIKQTIICKTCKTKYIINNENNVNYSKVDALLEKNGYDSEIRKELCYLIFPINVEYFRDKFEKIKVHLGICPNCGKSKKLWFEGTNPKTYEYSEWEKEFNNY